MSILKYFEEIVCAIMLSLVILLICFNIFLRYTTGVSYPWVYEISGIFLVWIVFLGSSIAERMNRHLRVSTIAEWFGEKFVKSIEIFILCLQFVFFAFLIYLGVIVCKEQSIWKTPVLRLNMVFVSSSLVIGISLMAFYTVVAIIRLFLFHNDLHADGVEK